MTTMLLFALGCDAEPAPVGAADAGQVADAGGSDAGPGAIHGRRVFVTSSDYTGALARTPEGVDGLCDAVAARAGLPGAWVPLISDARSARDRVPGEGPYSDLAGRLIFPTVESMFTLTGTVGKLGLDESGGAQAFVPVWTGTTYTGTSSIFNCASWTSSAASEQGRAGISRESSLDYLSRNSIRCDQRAHLYCLEVQAH